MSPITVRALRPLLLSLAIGVAVPGLAACGGGDQMSQEQIEKIVDAQSESSDTVASTDRASDLARRQLEDDADQAVADEAVKRRKELERIEAQQKRETEKVMKGDVEEQPDDMDERRFRAQVAGVCDGAQARITKVSKAAEKASKGDDPSKLLKVATDYNDALGDFVTALKSVDAPPSQSELYDDWLGTIDDLSNTIRLQLVSLVDPKESAKLQEKTGKLTSKFLAQTAQLGVPCISFSS